jgi:hypothetical protein
MKHIKPYKIFENNSPNFPTTRDGVIQVCKRYGIEDYTINDNLSIDVDGDVRLDSKNLEYLPLRFNYVSGGFSCCRNILVSLEGSPQTVGGDFDCQGNELKTLEGSPQTVGTNFECSYNNLKTLEGSPQTVGGDFGCSLNGLKSLKGCPQTVGGDFDCFGNELKSLEGCPSVVNGNFNCSFNKLKDLEHISEVSGNIDIRHNVVYLLMYTFIDKADSFMIEDFIDYEIVRNGDTVMLDRLQTFIRDNDLEMPNLDNIKEHYKIIE